MAAKHKMDRGIAKNKKDHTLTNEEAEAIHDTFKLIDKNGDGRLSRSELAKATAILGQTMTEQAITELFDTCDLDGDGFIDYDEYTYMMKENFNPIENERDDIKAAFHMLDKENKGYIRTRDLKMVLLVEGSNLTETEVDLFLVEADKSGDGIIDYEEFVNSDFVTALF